jgi:LuxR family transcriptional regulator, regulator of acetate metabolism
MVVMPLKLAPASRPDRSGQDAAARRQAALRREVAAGLDRARRFVAVDPWPASGGPGNADAALEDVLNAILGRMRSEQHGLQPGALVELCELAIELQRLQGRVRQADIDRGLLALNAIGRSLDRPDPGESLEGRLERAVRDMVEMCGFDRSIVLRLRQDRMEIAATRFRAEHGWAAECHEYSVRHPAPFGPGLLEWEMVRRRRPALMIDPMHDPRAWWPMVRKFETLSYASSPVLVAGEAVAIVHADMYFAGRQVGAVDRDIVAAYVAGLSREIERHVLQDRLRGQREAVRSLVRATEATVTEFCDTELWRGMRFGASPADAADPVETDKVPAPQDAPIDTLTRRERQVLDLVATGATNAAIARRLVVSDHTVKSHVEHILAKLGAVNRAEAVARLTRPGRA